MCQNTKFNLRIIGIHKSISFFRNKYFTNQTSKFHPYRNILKIRFGTADSSGRRNRLVKFSMLRTRYGGKVTDRSGIYQGCKDLNEYLQQVSRKQQKNNNLKIKE